ncbi:vegetative cell wall protein gp1-like [Zingiber officinale]|uniref:vegetative cell wall protein gp1-like n=1 Tax=Zingiber officinale TaxID=94328 RepID=UPI001C4DAC79|nr:vegetative cell wall protein gp1-like [Zingiber officinale]
MRTSKRGVNRQTSKLSTEKIEQKAKSESARIPRGTAVEICKEGSFGAGHYPGGIFWSQNPWSTPGPHNCNKTPLTCQTRVTLQRPKAKRPSLAISFSSVEALASSAAKALVACGLPPKPSPSRDLPPAPPPSLRPPAPPPSLRSPSPPPPSVGDLQRRLVACGLPSSTSCRPPAPPPVLFLANLFWYSPTTCPSLPPATSTVSTLKARALAPYLSLKSMFVCDLWILL